jgi:hypothetical protein
MGLSIRGRQVKQINLIAVYLVALPLVALSQEASTRVAQPNLLQTPAGSGSQELYREIAQRDKVLFDAFNGQNLAKLKTLFAPDLEFYHDSDGLASYAKTFKNFEQMFKQPNKIRRELVEGSLEVYPIKNYGAIQIGAHRFCHQENGKEECGVFKFVHIWQKRKGGWKLTRVISYNH